jgi:biotin operon repressor
VTTPSEPTGLLPADLHHDDQVPVPVAILRWPAEAGNVDRLRAAGLPRLLLVGPDAAAPVGTDCAEDWVRLPADDRDVRARTLAVAVRAARHDPAPEVKGDGRIAFRDRWVAISHAEESILRVLVEQFGEVVPGDTLGRRLGLTNNAVRVQLARLRRRIRPLALVVRTVRGRGYVLESDHPRSLTGPAGRFDGRPTAVG